MDRQRYMLRKIIGVTRAEFNFENFEEVSPYFKRLINAFKQMNYSVYNSEDYKKYEKEADEILGERVVNA